MGWLSKNPDDYRTGGRWIGEDRPRWVEWLVQDDPLPYRWLLNIPYLAAFGLMFASRDWGFGWMDRTPAVDAAIAALFLTFVVGSVARRHILWRKCSATSE